MARTGVLYSQLAAVATQLTARGISATVDNVREALGNTGSKSTIAPLLKRWKSEQAVPVLTAQTGLPTNLVAAVKNLYEHLQHETNQKVDAVLTQLESEKANFDEQVNLARDTITRLKTERDTLAEALTQEQNAHEKLGATYHDLQIIEAQMRAEAAGLMQRLQDHRNEIGNLQQQLHQTRTQLEHYQESIANQRIEERRDFEHVKTTLKAEILEMRSQVETKNIMLAQQDQKIVQLKQADEELQSAKTNHRELEGQYLKVTQTLSTQTALATELSARFEAASEALLDAQNQLAILNHELPQMQARNIDLEAKVAALETSCQTLRIEKATLEGQLSNQRYP